MTDIFLGIIAVSLLVMAIIQVTGIVMVVRISRRVERITDRVEAGVDRVLVTIQGLTDDAARAVSAVGGLLGIFGKSRRKDDEATRSPHPDDPTFVG